MFDDLKQFVSSEYCCSCRGCCVFHDAQTIWGPHVACAEAEEMRRLGLGADLSSDRKHILTEPAGASHRCSCLGSADHLCRIYQIRPFECRLYPFVISSEQGRLRLYAHLACPFVQDTFHSAQGQAYLSYLRTYFSRHEVRRVLRDQKDIFPDYSSAYEQIEVCFDLMGEDLLPRQEEIEGWIARRMPALSSVSFVSAWAWRDFFDFHLEKIAGNLCLFADQPVGTFLYWPPLGPTISPEAIALCFARMRAYNKGSGLSRIENVSRRDADFFDTSLYDVRLQGYEYVYYRQDIVHLRGDAYKSRRHDINQLKHTESPQYRPFLPSDSEPCAELFERWLDKRWSHNEDDTYRYMLQDNRHVHRHLIAHADVLGLVGRVVTIRGRIVGYTFGYPLGADTFCDLLEVADPDVAGLSAFLFREFCADPALEKFSFVNAMDDFGMPNVSRGKMSYRPAVLEPRYSVTEREHV